MRAATSAWATTRRNDGELVVDRRRRSVRVAHLDDELVEPIAARLRELLPAVAQLYAESLVGIESPQFLTYGPGDGYALHRDAPLEPTPEQRRRVSAVLFLNHEFTGGALRLYHTLGARWIFEPIVDAKSGRVVGDIGDGAIHRPDYTCEGGQKPIAGIRSAEGEPVAIEGSVCCPAAA